MRQDLDWHRARRAPARPRHRPWRDLAGMAAFGLAGGLLIVRIGAPAAPDTVGAIAGTRFGLCHTGGGGNCVVDGDTFWMAGEKIRVADIDAPETHPPRCAEESRLGGGATLRLQQLLNGGPVTLAAIDRDSDRYGRKLRIVRRGGVSLGDALIAEGLARRWTGHREPWCS